MRRELPVFKRCCFCLPLRYGLIAWGYIRLIIGILLFIGTSQVVFVMLRSLISFSNNKLRLLVILGVYLVTVTDIVLNIVIVVGGYKKNIMMLRGYYVYSFILCVLTTLSGVAIVIYTSCVLNFGGPQITFEIWLVCLEIASLLALTLIQVYVILLVRSEIIKLRSNCQFRFVNNAAESECTMRCEDEIASGGEGIENIETAREVPKETCQFIGYVQKNDDCYLKK